MPEPVWEAVAARPAGPLRAVVAEHHGYRQRGVLPARHLGLPSPWLTLIFTLDEPLHVARHPDPQQAPAHYRALVGGLHTTPAVIVHDGAQSGIQLQVSPLGARALLGLPAGELAGLDVARGGRARPARHRAAGAAARRRLLGRALPAARRPAGPAAGPGPPAAAPEVRRAWRVLRASGGTARIADVAREVGWSERHLAARFRTEIGLAPKAAARVIRFDRARHLLPRVPGGGRGGDLRLRRPGAPGPRVRGVHRARAARVARRGGRESSRPRRRGGARLGVMSDKTPPPQVWPTFRATDARALIRFLVDVVGFEETAVYGEGDVVHHAELSWPLGGGVMLGSVRPDDGNPEAAPTDPGRFSAYVVTDEPDALCARIRAAGAR